MYNYNDFDNYIKKIFENYEPEVPNNIEYNLIKKIKQKIFLKKFFLLLIFPLSIPFIYYLVFPQINKKLKEKRNIMPTFFVLDKKNKDLLLNISKNSQVNLKTNIKLKINIKNRLDNSTENVKPNFLNTQDNINSYNEDTLTEKDYFYSIKVFPSLCNMHNGKIEINCSNCNNIEFFFDNKPVINNRITNLGTGFYQIYVFKNRIPIDTISTYVYDSLNIISDFKINIIEENIFYFENTTKIDNHYWTKNKEVEFEWYINNEKISSEPSTFYVFNEPGDYTVKLISKFKNCEDSVLKNVTISNIILANKIQNIFTPNNDGINDYFEPEFKNLIVKSCYIFDRNGNLVYQTKNGQIRWDGKLSDNSNAPEGVYYYVICLINKNNQEFKLKGFLHLTR